MKELNHNIEFVLKQLRIDESKISRALDMIKNMLKEKERLSSIKLNTIYYNTKDPRKRAFIIQLLLGKGLTNKQIINILNISNSSIYQLKNKQPTIDYKFRDEMIRLIKPNKNRHSLI